MIDLFEMQGVPDVAYHSFCIPEYRALLQNRPDSLVVVGASRAGQPIGLALAKWQEQTQTANLLSVVVAENERRQGIGASLLQGLNILLQRRGCRAVSAEFVVEVEAEHLSQPSAEAAFLQAQGFATPHPGIHIWSGSLQITGDLLWLDTCKLTSDFGLGSWASLTPAEREVVEQGEGVWYPPILSPFVEEALIDPERSLLLRYRGEVVGWMILESLAG